MDHEENDVSTASALSYCQSIKDHVRQLLVHQSSLQLTDRSGSSMATPLSPLDQFRSHLDKVIVTLRHLVE